MSASDHGSSTNSSFRRKFVAQHPQVDDDEDPASVDTVVVENTLPYSQWAAQTKQPSGGSDHVAGGNGTHGGGTQQGYGHSDASSFRNTANEDISFWEAAVGLIRWRLYPLTNQPTVNETWREHIKKNKSTSIFGACFLILTWVLGLALLPKPWSVWNKIFFYGLNPLAVVPLLPMAVLDFPRRHWWVWQVWVTVAISLIAISNVIDIYACRYYVPELKDCGNKDFQATLYYASGLPVVALFAMAQARIFAFLSGVVWIVLVGIFILPLRVSWIRNVVNIAVFLAFILYMHYKRELAERRMYTLRAELKVQYRATQKAQISERKVMDSNKRFSSYIFHEVRVPLNTALLAVQNLEGTGLFDRKGEHGVELQALEGSLQMMSQVLNDVLDYTRMEKGGFLSVSRPFSFHNAMASMFVPLKLDASRRGLVLETSLDPRIDEVAKHAAHPDEPFMAGKVSEGDGMVMGDEMRLRQVITNLASNACKFTPQGGKVSIRTTLVHPTEAYSTVGNKASPGDDSTHSSDTVAPGLSASQLQQHEAKSGPPANKVMVVRIEVADTGAGIHPRDMMESRLFSAYVQTEIGRATGGKGTGLGLSLVRQIVLLTGGQLGLRSRVGEGSCFWVELPFVCGPEVLVPLEAHKRVSSTAKEPHYSVADPRLLPSVDAPPALEQIAEGPDADGLPKHYRFASPHGSPALEQPPQPGGKTEFFTPADDLPLVPPPPISDTAPPRPDLRETISSPPQLAKAGSSRALVLDGGPLKVLIVDDDLLTRRLMGRMMTRLGCEVSLAENGQVGFDMITALPANETRVVPAGVDPRSGDAPKNYDIIFLDNQMPICSGPELAAKLRALARDDVIYAVTANAQRSEQEKFLRMGASAVLTKPVLEDDLKQALLYANKKRTERINRPPNAAFVKPTRPTAAFRTDSFDASPTL